MGRCLDAAHREDASHHSEVGVMRRRAGSFCTGSQLLDTHTEKAELRPERALHRPREGAAAV